VYIAASDVSDTIVTKVCNPQCTSLDITIGDTSGLEETSIERHTIIERPILHRNTPNMSILVNSVVIVTATDSVAQNIGVSFTELSSSATLTDGALSEVKGIEPIVINCLR